MTVCAEEYRHLLGDGCRYFCFQGEDTGAYGIDIGTSLPELFSALSAVDGDLPVKWGLATLNPKWLVRYRQDLSSLVRQGKIGYLEIDVQSGSDRILALMKREYDASSVRSAIVELKEANPDVAVHLQVMVGFPSESEADFRLTLDFIKESRADHFQVFGYSDMEGTASSALESKVSEATKNRRRAAVWGLRQARRESPLDTERRPPVEHGHPGPR